MSYKLYHFKAVTETGITCVLVIRVHGVVGGVLYGYYVPRLLTMLVSPLYRLLRVVLDFKTYAALCVGV